MKKKIFVIPLVILVFFLLILCCAREPKKELAAAQDALEKARGAQADRYASDIFTQAENSLKEAEKLIAQKNYGEAKSLLITAKGVADTAASQAAINKEEVKVEAEDAISESQKALEQLKETQGIALQSKLPKDKTDLSQQLPNWEDQLKKAQEEYDNGNFDVAKEIAVTAYQQISTKNNELNELIMAKQPTLMIDSFDKEPNNVDMKYPHFASTQAGYDIYYVSATVQLSIVQTSSRDTSNKALQLEFSLPPAFDWGNWLSVRREFNLPLNLEAYKGLELSLRFDLPSPNAFLRITICDLLNDKDEMWWFDFDRRLLKNKTQKWIQIRAPFTDFVVSHGDGTRHNDYKKDLKKIIAYEINLVSDAGANVNGVIVLDSLRAYK